MARSQIRVYFEGGQSRGSRSDRLLPLSNSLSAVLTEQSAKKTGNLLLSYWKYPSKLVSKQGKEFLIAAIVKSYQEYLQRI
jgi:hypothetical protein